MFTLPNILTLFNLYAGCLGIVLVLQNQPWWSLFCFGLSLLFDVLDGLAARATGKHNTIGAELDSLADIVSFGVLPGVMLYTLLEEASLPDPLISETLPFLAFVHPLFGALRLAKFNLDTRQANYFFGLPIPSAAIYWAGLYLVNHSTDCTTCLQIFLHPMTLILSLVVICWLMVSDHPHFHLKVDRLGWQDRLKWLFLIIAILLLVFLREMAPTLIIAFYVVISLFKSRNTTEAE